MAAVPVGSGRNREPGVRIHRLDRTGRGAPRPQTAQPHPRRAFNATGYLIWLWALCAIECDKPGKGPPRGTATEQRSKCLFTGPAALPHALAPHPRRHKAPTRSPTAIRPPKHPAVPAHRRGLEMATALLESPRHKSTFSGPNRLRGTQMAHSDTVDNSRITPRIDPRRVDPRGMGGRKRADHPRGRARRLDLALYR